MSAWRILTGDTLALLPTLDAGSVQTCITSPPYFGLRDYGHDGQIGLESTPDAYVSKLVAVFREVRRVLRDDGTLWLNLGDSYAGRGRTGGTASFQGSASSIGCKGWVPPAPGFKDKDLYGIPWRVAFALQSDGWYLRQDIIWHKPNPMPESVRDRCTKAHEYVFLLAKSERYYFDTDAMQENAVYPAGTKAAKGSAKRSSAEGVNSRPPEYAIYTGKRNRRSVWTVNTRPFADAHFATFPPDLVLPMVLAGSREGDTVLDPFNGAGTTGLVAIQQGRQYVGCELNPEYVAMSERRLGAVTPLFQEVSA